MSGNAAQRRRLGWGLVSTVLVTAGAALVWGRPAIVAAATFGAVATGLQLLAARVMGRSGVPAALDHLKVYLTGVLLRLSGVAMLGVAVSLDRVTFPPAASAAGYLGTVLPLLYLETRLSR